jgi:fused signal recognition particle receptor
VIEVAVLTAASDALLAVAVAVPVALVAGGVAIATHRRGRGSKVTTSEPGPGPSGGGVAVADRPAEAPAVTPDTAPVIEPTPAPEPEPVSYRGRLGKARGLLSGYIGAVRARGKIDATTWDDLEEALIRADVGVGAADALLDDLRGRVKSGEIGDPNALVDALKADLVAMLTTDSSGLAPIGSGQADVIEGEAADGEAARTVDVWLFVGVNGVGKTTTLGKVATRLSRAGTPVLLAAGDTFRAAAAEQLELWAERAGADIVRGAEGGDPSSVVFDAVQRAASKGHPLVLADTAGRLHNKVNLIEELKKIRRVSDRPPGRVTEVLLVLDATTGQNGLAQAKVFLDAVDVSGVVLTKLDGTAKGGIVVAIQRELGLPVKLVGLGEGPEDLIDFDPQAFVDALF